MAIPASQDRWWSYHIWLLLWELFLSRVVSQKVYISILIAQAEPYLSKIRIWFSFFIWSAFEFDFCFWSDWHLYLILIFRKVWIWRVHTLALQNCLCVDWAIVCLFLIETLIQSWDWHWLRRSRRTTTRWRTIHHWPALVLP